MRKIFGRFKKMYDAIILLSGVNCNKTKLGGWGFSVYEINGSDNYKYLEGDKKIAEHCFGSFYLSNNGISRHWQKAEVGDEFFTVLNVVNLYEVYGSAKEPASLAKAESQGFLEALKYIEDRKWKDIFICCDSRYVAKNLERLINDKEYETFKRKSGEITSTYDQWTEITELVLKLSSANVSIKWHWLKEFMPLKMEEYSKLLAKKGQALAFNKKQKVEEIYEFGKKTIPENKAHGFLTQGRLYFIPSFDNVDENNEKYYFCGNHGKDDNRCGKPKSDNTMSVFIIKEVDPVLEMLFKIKRHYSCDNSGNIIRLDNIKTASVRNEILTYHKDLMFYSHKHGNLYDYAGRNLIIEQNPPYLFFKLYSKLEDLYAKLCQINSGMFPEEYKFIDITDKVFTRNAKGVLKINQELNIKKCVKLKLKDLNAKITLTVGIELLPELGLKRLVNKNPIFKVYIEKVTPFLYKYYLHFKTNDAVGLFTTTDANSIFVKPNPSY